MAGRDLTMGPLPHSVRLVCRTIRRPIQNLLPGMCLALVSGKGFGSLSPCGSSTNSTTTKDVRPHFDAKGLPETKGFKKM